MNMRELGVALGRMHGQADLGWRDMATGGWAQLESIYSIPWSEQKQDQDQNQNPESCGLGYLYQIKWVWLLKGFPGTCAGIN